MTTRPIYQLTWQQVEEINDLIWKVGMEIYEILERAKENIDSSEIMNIEGISFN